MANPENDDQWWMVEPPENLDEQIEDESSYECIDGTKSHPLFHKVIFSENERALTFVVPPRFIDTPNHGKWWFSISGERRWFKERDEYGKIRYLESGESIWIPHLFPFEETTPDGLPLILDRERCELMVMLQPLGELDALLQTRTSTAVTSAYDDLIADESSFSYNPSFTRYFDEFTSANRPLVSDLVTYSNGPAARSIPSDWTDREPSGYIGAAFGSVWVPVDDLRRGIQAEILFPCFMETSQPAKDV